uniref:WAP domain-containing protein n=1 Tax=Gopherus agassizii TaxID=38772 RepID=A0A452HLQ4_9SAUR
EHRSPTGPAEARESFLSLQGTGPAVSLPAKPGICPKRRVSQDFTPCTNQCHDDRHCPEGQKCCFAGCGLACMSPYTEKAGVCPAVQLEQPEGLCLDTCVDDADCPGDEKCCATGCGYKCRVPLPGTTC